MPRPMARTFLPFSIHRRKMMRRHIHPRDHDDGVNCLLRRDKRQKHVFLPERHGAMQGDRPSDYETDHGSALSSRTVWLIVDAGGMVQSLIEDRKLSAFITIHVY